MMLFCCVLPLYIITSNLVIRVMLSCHRLVVQFGPCKKNAFDLIDLLLVLADLLEPHHSCLLYACLIVAI